MARLLRLRVVRRTCSPGRRGSSCGVRSCEARARADCILPPVPGGVTRPARGRTGMAARAGIRLPFGSLNGWFVSPSPGHSEPLRLDRRRPGKKNLLHLLALGSDQSRQHQRPKKLPRRVFIAAQALCPRALAPFVEPPNDHPAAVPTVHVRASLASLSTQFSSEKHLDLGRNPSAPLRLAARR